MLAFDRYMANYYHDRGGAVEDSDHDHIRQLLNMIPKLFDILWQKKELLCDYKDPGEYSSPPTPEETIILRDIVVLVAQSLVGLWGVVHG